MTGTENGGRSGSAALCYPLLVRGAKSRGDLTQRRSALRLLQNAAQFFGPDFDGSEQLF
jgi:hypothetical protein